MFWVSFLTLLGLQEALALPTPDGASGLKAANHVVNLKRTGVSSKSSKALRELISTATTKLEAVESGAGYAVNVELNGDTFTLSFDTGSSDLWVASTGVQCVNANGKDVAASKCDFGPLFSGTFSGGAVANENFNVSYGDGEMVVGTLGYEDVTLAGITIDNQEIAAVDEAYFEAGGVLSGILGFAFSSLTSAYPGTNPADDNPLTNNIHYPNWLRNAILQDKIDPLFSLALERGANGGSGQLALGGLPTITFDHDFTSTPLEIIEITPHTIEATKYSYYTIKPSGLGLDGESKSTTFNAIVDSGTTLVYLPTELAEDINAAFDPPSIYIEDEGIFENYCDATPPDVAINIGGTNFEISGAELLLKDSRDPTTKGCVTGIQPSPGPFILGDVFLKNVVAVFDVGTKQMRFAPHVNY